MELFKQIKKLMLLRDLRYLLPIIDADHNKRYTM